MKTSNEVLVTPEMAAAWLESSKGNRAISRGQVEKLKADMVSGLWQYNGDRIRFLKDGTLYDGHHRLTACVESGKSILTDIFIMPEAAKSTVDKGKSRTTADNLALELGVDPSKSSSIAAAVRYMIVHDHTQITDWAKSATLTAHNASVLSEQKIEEYFLENRQKILDASDWVSKHIKRSNMIISKGHSIAFLVLAGRKYGEDDAYDYLNQVCTGYGVLPGSATDNARNILLSVKMKQSKMIPSHKMYTLIKNFKSMMAGRTIAHIGNARFRPSADTVPRLL